ncbi:MAG: hypothetical protein ABL952_08030 [Pyrinomonadaceae bacterium]
MLFKILILEFYHVNEMSITLRTIPVLIALAILCGIGQAQLNVDNRTSIFEGPEKDERPKSIKEKLVQMQIEKDKKDHEEMVARGEEAVKLSTELEKSFSERGSLLNTDIEKLEKVEKLVKKIRSGLGGNDDDDESERSENSQQTSGKGLVGGAIETLKSRSTALLAELKKTTRFTISAAAISTSNALLRITKILRFRQ